MTSSAQYVPLHSTGTGSLRNLRLCTSDYSARPHHRPVCPRFSPRAAAAAVCTLLVVVGLLAHSRGPPRTERDLQLLEVGVEPDKGFPDLWQVAQSGWREYTPERRQAANDGALVSWAERLPAECADDWVEHGELCGELEGGRLGNASVDLVWTFVNGSDPLLRRWRAEVTGTLSGRVKPGVARVRDRKASHHFRCVPLLVIQGLDGRAELRPAASTTSCVTRSGRRSRPSSQVRSASCTSFRPTCLPTSF